MPMQRLLLLTVVTTIITVLTGCVPVMNTPVGQATQQQMSAAAQTMLPSMTNGTISTSRGPRDTVGGAPSP
jgi:hypothetical protein